MKRENINILYIETEIQLLDIPRALDELGFNVYKTSLGRSAQGYEKEACKRMVDAIDHSRIQCVISYDFSESIAQACYTTGIPYIAWVYDVPQVELYTHYAQYPGNYVFVFDKMQQKRLQNIGLENVYHMPLAVHCDKVKMNLTDNEESACGYIHDISFIGQLYHREIVQNAYDKAADDIKTSLENNIETCFLKWDDATSVHGIMEEFVVSYYSELDSHKMAREYPYVTEQYVYESAALSRMIANRERVHILNTLAEKYGVALYTFDKYTEQLSEKVEVYPGVGYDFELSKIYRQSKINLNITLHCIETGASQRIFDIMAAGGFMLSNYQKELTELFVPGEEIVLYHNMEELQQLVEYYLTHEEERERIAKKGQEKVLRLHGYHNKLLRVMELVYEKEQPRNVSYIEQDRRQLIKLADEALAKGTKEAYLRLNDIFRERRYETAIQRTTMLGCLREMLELYCSECAWKESKIFSNIHSLGEAEERYLCIKHGLWRIEQNQSEEKCMQVMDMIETEQISLFFVTWQIFVNMKYKEELYLTIGEYYRSQNLATAIEFYTYALWWLKDNSQLLLYKAECLMDGAMFKDALDTLEQIKDPSEDVVSLIQELRAALK